MRERNSVSWKTPFWISNSCCGKDWIIAPSGKIILIEKTNKPRPVIEALITPYKLVSLNEIFLATGDIEFRAVLRRQDQDNLLFTHGELEEMVLELTGNVIRVEFE